MKFLTAKKVVAKRLYEYGLRRPKLLFKPGRGDFFNRLAYGLVRGKFGVIPKSLFNEDILPGKVIDKVEGVELLAFRGDEEADAVVVKRKGTVDFSDITFNYPDFAVDLSLFKELTERERKSLAVQIEITYGTVKDYFTPENFYLTSAPDEALSFLKGIFKPFPFRLLDSFEEYERVIVLDPNAEEEFTHTEVTPNTLIVVGGIVDSSERLKGSTSKIMPDFLHRKITYKGIVSVVPDRINEIVKIVCDYLTSDLSLYEAVKRNLTRDSKLRFLRKLLQEESVRFLFNGRLLRGIPEETYLKWKEELSLTDFFFRKAAKHVSGFFVFRSSIFDRVIGETKKRGKRVYILKELKDEDVVVQYP
ncbi:tRNA (adenine9-N1/guanine9-N1)-methyltransferase [Thermovibrio guaymasensis]|uniref:tRNA (Adenine9-N1/guanine9-N1)-methyltransferase n=1 Tax=Thermovibrio guaymasensis TaxID=240167 RepID=A0A420W7U8_9BACT|nr:tRNA (guanine-N1)-methyltransferase [Thermovibrio guaymasensis]RKQ63400.1 tRNA (adenine9-N1/guanine9-N1)-methyltransferase [Thermovibrio guaymasensis]